MCDLMNEEIEIPEKGIVLVVSKTNHYNEVNNKIIKTIVNSKNKYCVYLSLNKPSFTIFEDLSNIGVNLSKILLVDCVTKLAGDDIERAGNVVFIESPQNLTEIGTILDETLKRAPSIGSFLFLDSISTMLLYNAARNVAAFIHFLTLKIRYYKMAGVIVSLEEEETRQLIAQISQFCDSKIFI